MLKFINHESFFIDVIWWVDWLFFAALLWVKAWLGYPKGLLHFIIARPHLNMLLKPLWHVHIEILILFIDIYITKVLFYA